MLPNTYLSAKVGFDTAENEPAKKLQTYATFCNARSPSAKIGLKDFRSAGGLYHTLSRMFPFLTAPEEIFSKPQFDKDYRVLYSACRELFSVHARPTRLHALIAVLHERGQVDRRANSISNSKSWRVCSRLYHGDLSNKGPRVETLGILPKL